MLFPSTKCCPIVVSSACVLVIIALASSNCKAAKSPGAAFIEDKFIIKKHGGQTYIEPKRHSGARSDLEAYTDPKTLTTTTSKPRSATEAAKESPRTKDARAAKTAPGAKTSAKPSHHHHLHVHKTNRPAQSGGTNAKPKDLKAGLELVVGEKTDVKVTVTTTAAPVESSTTPSVKITVSGAKSTAKKMRASSTSKTTTTEAPDNRDEEDEGDEGDEGDEEDEDDDSVEDYSDEGEYRTTVGPDCVTTTKKPTTQNHVSKKPSTSAAPSQLPSQATTTKRPKTTTTMRQTTPPASSKPTKASTPSAKPTVMTSTTKRAATSTTARTGGSSTTTSKMTTSVYLPPPKDIGEILPGTPAPMGRKWDRANIKQKRPHHHHREPASKPAKITIKPLTP